MYNLKDMNDESRYLKSNSLKNKKVIIGYFDVIHKGHKKLFENNLDSVILTFTNVPSKTFSSINNLNSRITNLKELGFKKIFIFDIKTNMKAFAFYNQYLKDIKKIIAGSDCKIGSDQKYLNEIVPPKQLQIVERNDLYSTTSIKQWLKNGELDKVNECLLFPFRIEHVVDHGNKLGKIIGYPTANFNLDPNFPLCDGVYLSYTYYKNKKYRSLSFWGKPSSFINVKDVKTFETHILDFDKDIYNKVLVVEPIEKIADIQKVNSIPELKKLIASYVDVWKKY